VTNDETPSEASDPVSPFPRTVEELLQWISEVIGVRGDPLAYSVAQATKVAGVGRTSLCQAISEGKLPARKHGRRTLILRDDLVNYLESLPRWTSEVDG
jgi:excisionase family DNA binding protein